MKKVMILAVMMFFVFTMASGALAGDSREAKASGEVTTTTNTYMNTGTLKNCGSSCGQTTFVNLTQAGVLDSKAKSANGGSAKLTGGYDTGYDLTKSIPGGSFTAFGEQWANSTVKTTSSGKSGKDCGRGRH